jgi:hypothetical protein
MRARLKGDLATIKGYSYVMYAWRGVGEVPGPGNNALRNKDVFPFFEIPSRWFWFQNIFVERNTETSICTFGGPLRLHVVPTPCT